MITSYPGLSTPPSLTTIRFNTLKLSKNQALEHLSGILGVEVSLHTQLPDLLCVPVTGPHAVQRLKRFLCVDARCGEAVMRGAQIYSPGVLASNCEFK